VPPDPTPLERQRPDSGSASVQFLHGQAFCIASTARTRKSSCMRWGRASIYAMMTWIRCLIIAPAGERWLATRARNERLGGRQDVLLSSLRSTLFGDVLAAFQE
jgi:hypothetical protein